MLHSVHYATEQNLTVEEFKQVLVASGLAERRPVEDDSRLMAMLKHANLTVTARVNGKLIGVSRALSDFSFCTYLSDLAVDKAYKRSGIGKELIRHTKLASPLAKLILLSAPAAVNYYPHIGMKHHAHCYVIDDVLELV